MINRDDEAIQRLTKQALEGAPKDPAARAERLRAFVRGYISQKDLDTAMASASDVVRTKAGDCTEHAVLLAALLRADGIASRVVSGLIYADRFAGANDVFAYHMWTEALLGVNGTPTWVDLDATLPATGPAFDATHVAVLTSAMDDGKTASTMASLVPLLGRLQIKVEHVE
jgi:transglutaminase-like putative cysteine protease